LAVSVGCISLGNKKDTINGGKALLNLQSIVQNSLKSICSLLKVHSFSRWTKSSVPGKSYLLIFFIPLLAALCSIPISAVHAAQVRLSWDPSSGPVAGYYAYYGTSSGNYDYRFDAGNYTSYTISGLQEGEKYYFAVTAYNDVGESNLSEELTYTIPIGNSQQSFSNPVSTESLPIENNVEEGNLSQEIVHTIPIENPQQSFSSQVSAESLSIEFDEIQIDDQRKHVVFRKSFVDPIVIANSLSLNGPDPAVVRISNVTGKGFDIQIQEWDYLDGFHTFENVSYLVMERGSFTLENGARVEAGQFSTDKVNSFVQVNFNQGFTSAPVVITSINSFKGPAAVTGRVNNVNAQGFQYTMQEQESFSDGHAAESIAYIAWEPSAGNIAGITYKIGKTGKMVDDNLHTIRFGEAFADLPVFFADMQTAYGMDPANIRWQSLNVDAAKITISEERSLDDEIVHVTEDVGYFVFVLD
jgi:hypothetical protein